jgi:hypothetical protein
MLLELCKVISFHNVGKPLGSGQARPKQVREYNVLNAKLTEIKLVDY